MTFIEGGDGRLVTRIYDTMNRLTDELAGQGSSRYVYTDEPNRTVVSAFLNGRLQGHFAVNRFSDVVEMRDERRMAANVIDVSDSGKFVSLRKPGGDELRAMAWNPQEVPTDLRHGDGANLHLALNGSGQITEQTDDVLSAVVDYTELGIAFGTTAGAKGGPIRLRKEVHPDERDVTQIAEEKFGAPESLTAVQEYTHADDCEGWGPQLLCINEDVLQCI